MVYSEHSLLVNGKIMGNMDLINKEHPFYFLKINRLFIVLKKHIKNGLNIIMETFLFLEVLGDLMKILIYLKIFVMDFQN